METAHHHLRFYQAQYQPSFSHLDADQAKVDDYLALGVDALNTPNIDPDFFNEGNLFSNEKVHLKSAKVDPLLGGATEDSYHMGSSISNGSTTTLINGNAIFGDLVAPVHQMNTLQMPSTSTSSSYSPQQQLEISSQIININSPEMMSSSSASTSSSSPNNKSSYHTNPTGSYLGNIEDDPTFYSQVAEYEQLAFYGSPEANGYATGSAPNSRSSSISSGSGCEGVINPSNNYDYLLSDCMTSTELNSSINTTTSTSSTSTNSLNSRLAPSPASSHYSSDSASSKTFTNLDAIQQIQQQQQQQQQQIISHNGQLISIKQEPVDTIYQPTVIEEFESGQQQQLYQPMDNTYTTISAADLAYYCTPQQQQNQQQYNSQQLPSTVNSVLLQPQMQQQQQPIPSTSSTGRKRNAAAAFSGAASSASSSSSSSSTASATRAAGTTNSTTTSSSSQKPRMTKREKQKMMESDIGKFETENRDLRQSIDLLERQIAFCKRFLSENVAPVIQRQQQNSSSTTVVSANGQQQFTCSPMMIAVSEM